MAKKAGSKKPEPGTGDDAIATSIGAALEGAAASSATTPDGTRCMFTLSAGAIRLLDTAVLVDGKDRSAVVEGLITEHLCGYYSGRQDRAPAAAGG
jgi:hypothetical protein